MFENNDFNTVNAVQEGVVDHPEAVVEASEADGAQQPSGGVAPSQDPNGKQSAVDNHAFAEMRKSNEALKTANNSLLDGLSKLGYKGTAEEILEQIAIEQSGMSEEEYLQEKKSLEERINRDPRVVEAERIMRESRFREDLQAIKDAYPDCDAKSVEELGDVFLNLMRSGAVSAVDAYAAQLAHNERKESKIPAKVGNLNQNTPPEKDFYTDAELDNLSSADLEDERVLLRALESLKRNKR